MMSLANLASADESTTASASLLASATEKSTSDSLLPDPDEPPVKKSKKAKTGTGKKRVYNEMNHKTKFRKFMRNTGQEYVTKNGKVVKAKVFENKDCSCSKRCLTKITSEQRQKCFEKFWKMGDFSKQNAYLSGLVTREAVRRHRPGASVKPRGPKGVTYQYRLNVGRISRQVCKVYFLDTFCVSNGRLARALRKEENEREPGEDLRGKKSPVNKTTEEQKQRVRDHINSFARYDVHFQPSSKGKFLKPELNVKKMYNLYHMECQMQNEQKFVKENIYRQIFNEDFNLSFLSPRKDPLAMANVERSPPQPKPRAPRKKTFPTKLLTARPTNEEIYPLSMRPPDAAVPIRGASAASASRCGIPSQLFSSADTTKCYNPSIVNMSMQQDKDSVYTPACQAIMSSTPFYHQDHQPPTSFHNQTSFFNL